MNVFMIAEVRKSIQQKVRRKLVVPLSLVAKYALSPYRESMHVIGGTSAVANHIGYLKP